MTVIFEFLGNEPIENVITCMNFKVDKVIFFGYREAIQAQKRKTENFLTKYCGVQQVVFLPLAAYDLQFTLRTMKNEIQREKEQENQIYFDVTGGETLILVAFGMLAKEFETPIHVFDIAKDALIELESDTSASICKEAEQRKIPMTLKLWIEMHGGVVNNQLHKGIKTADDAAFVLDADKIYQVAEKHWDDWNTFADFLRNVMIPVTNLTVHLNTKTVQSNIKATHSPDGLLAKVNRILDELAQQGILLDLKHSEGHYHFRYKNQKIKECLWEGGSILELHVFFQEEPKCDDCQMGVHLDWNGIIHEHSGEDVLNEIDVLTLQGNIPTFISCKSGKIGAQQTLHALYELDTVAHRFGGKYAKKVLVSARKVADIYKERAKEMGIVVK